MTHTGYTSGAVWSKARACEWCGDEIPAGSQGVLWGRQPDGGMRLHPECCTALQQRLEAEGYGWSWDPMGMERGKPTESRWWGPAFRPD